MIKYMSGEEVMVGDVVRINDERSGTVIAVVENATSDEERYLLDMLGPGATLRFDGWGEIYYGTEELGNDEDLFLVSRAKNAGAPPRMD
jgi:hypothetical protein